MDRRVNARYTDNFYDRDGNDNPVSAWSTVDVPVEYWYVRDTSDEQFGNPEGVILSGDIAKTGLIELVLTPDTLRAMLVEFESGRKRLGITD